MRAYDLARFTAGALYGHRLRSVLSAVGVAIGVAAVVLLTSLGEGTRREIVSQFTQFGTSLMAINPGKVKTFGIPGVFGGTTHRLTFADAEALRRLPNVDKVVPVVFGQARVEAGGRGRSVYVYGVNSEASAAWNFPVAQGSFIPPMDFERKAATVVLGPKLAREILPGEPPLGKRLRIGGTGFVVVGVMEPKGQFVGFDLDDSAYVPTASAMDLFNMVELMEIDILPTSAEAVPSVVDEVRRLLTARHRGSEDFTITTQTEMLDTFGRVMDVITVSVSAIAGISLLVGAIGILTIMWISVNERTAEIGLLRALGMTRRGVEAVFLAEAALLAGAGGLAGLLAGYGLGALLSTAVPGIPIHTPLWAAGGAMAMSVAVGLASGWLPARRAAGLDPVEALRAE
jgi:putative ABC transport system permease protein